MAVSSKGTLQRCRSLGREPEPRRVYAFGSSTPRDLSYLSLPRHLRYANSRLGDVLHISPVRRSGRGQGSPARMCSPRRTATPEHRRPTQQRRAAPRDMRGRNTTRDKQVNLQEASTISQDTGEPEKERVIEDPSYRMPPPPVLPVQLAPQLHSNEFLPPVNHSGEEDDTFGLEDKTIYASEGSDALKDSAIESGNSLTGSQLFKNLDTTDVGFPNGATSLLNVDKPEEWKPTTGQHDTVVTGGRNTVGVRIEEANRTEEGLVTNDESLLKDRSSPSGSSSPEAVTDISASQRGPDAPRNNESDNETETLANKILCGTDTVSAVGQALQEGLASSLLIDLGESVPDHDTGSSDPEQAATESNAHTEHEFTSTDKAQSHVEHPSGCAGVGVLPLEEANKIYIDDPACKITKPNTEIYWEDHEHAHEQAAEQAAPEVQEGIEDSGGCVGEARSHYMPSITKRPSGDSEEEAASADVDDASQIFETPYTGLG